MAGYWRARFAALAEVTGVDGPPRGALRGYAEDLLGGVLSAARSTVADNDYERLQAIEQMEWLALSVIDFDGNEKGSRVRSRAARGTRKAVPAGPVRRVSTRDRYRTRRSS